MSNKFKNVIDRSYSNVFLSIRKLFVFLELHEAERLAAEFRKKAEDERAKKEAVRFSNKNFL